MDAEVNVALLLQHIQSTVEGIDSLDEVILLYLTMLLSEGDEEGAIEYIEAGSGLEEDLKKAGMKPKDLFNTIYTLMDKMKNDMEEGTGEEMVAEQEIDHGNHGDVMAQEDLDSDSDSSMSVSVSVSMAPIQAQEDECEHEYEYSKSYEVEDGKAMGKAAEAWYDSKTPIEVLRDLVAPTGLTKEFDDAMIQANNDLDTAVHIVIRRPRDGPISICRHFLAGKCHYSATSCYYSHDLSTTTCKFWLQGECYSGDEECRFWHGGVEQATEKIYEYLDRTAGYDAYQEAKEAEKEKARTSAAPLSARKPLQIRSHGDQYRHGHMYGYRRYGPQPKLDEAAEIARSIEWCSTGDAVSREYREFREEADAEIRARTRCFQQATAAYSAGDGAAAKELSRLGREHNARAHVLQKNAGRELFHHRNSNPKHLPVNVFAIDLHGQHIEEIDELLVDSLIHIGSEPLFILTGTGHHSEQSSRSVKDMVERTLNNWEGVAWRDVSTDGKGGLIAVVREQQHVY